jgi:predicted dienelactone hydrolase
VATSVLVQGLAASTTSTSTSSGPPALRRAVGVTTETVVDPSRLTPANGAAAGHPGRNLVVTVFYPATGRPEPRPASGAAPDLGGAPYPLIVFAPGFGAAPGDYRALLVQWASAGYVVAEPAFPLTSAGVPGGADLADYVIQPGDMSFVVSELTGHQAAGGVLAGMVDPGEVGAGGHSLGGVTTLGLVANTCCQDQRIKAAVVMSGDALTFPSGDVR